MSEHSKSIRLYAAGAVLVVLALLVFVQAAFDMPFLKPAQTDEFVLVYTLSTLIFLVLLVFGFVLLRILVKVWAERKQNKPGSRFKTSLMAMLGVLTLIPAIAVFAYAWGLVNRSIDKWFSVPVDQIFSRTMQIEQRTREWQQQNAEAVLSFLSVDMPEDLERARKELRLKALIVAYPTGGVERSAAESDIDVGMAVVEANDAAARGTPVLAWNLDWLAVKPVDTPDGPRNLVAVVAAPRDIAELNQAIAEQFATYTELTKRKRWFRDNYRALLGLMTVLVLFASVWVALFLSKSITKPIEALAAATKEISAGNLDYRVDIQADDELGMLVALFNDMASRLQGTTAELETRRRYMEIILETIPTGVITVDANRDVQTVNRAARTMFSIENASRLEHLFKNEDLSEITSLLNAATDNSVSREISFHTPGRLAHSAVTASRLTTGGFVLVVEDLTEVVRAHKASAWREVARRLAHEIKNPLTPIQLSSERISRNIARLPGAPPRVAAVMRECVGAIMDEVSSLKNLVDEFVRFARLPTVSRVPHSMRDLVDRTLALYEGRLDGMLVTVAVPDDLPLILMDPMQMRRVLINLIDNAIEACSGEPDRSLKIRCDLARDGTMGRLVIEDNGRGIAADHHKHLFAPYFTTRKDGTGLGLSISSRIVADHGGYIGAEENSPRGTRFVIELPVCQESLLSTTNPAFGSR